MTDTTKEYACGLIGGLIGQTLCHPFDTIKTRSQKTRGYNLTQDLRSGGLQTLYVGLPSPLLSVIIEKALLFGSYNLIRKTLDLDPFTGGVAAGMLTTLTVTPFERVKVKCQISRQSSALMLTQIIKNDGLLSMYRGWSATFMREVPGYGLYFYTYETVKKLCNGNISPFTSFLTGSACGVASWLVIYPSDPVKTMMQNDNVGLRTAVQRIWSAGGVNGFYRGYCWGLCRAAILHGGVFLGYEGSKNLLTQKKVLMY